MGAVGNISINTGLLPTDGQVGEAVQAYNTIMLVLGAKNLAKGTISFVKNLPETTKSVIRSSQSLRQTLIAQLDKIKAARAELQTLKGEYRQADELVQFSDDFSDFLGVSKGATSAFDELMVTLKPKLGGKWDNFIADFGDDITMLHKFASEELSVDAWAKFFDAPDAIRKNIDLIEDVTSWPKSWKITKSGDGMVVANGSGKQLGTIYIDKIVAPARKVSGESGNALLNRVPLVKNMKYDVDAFIYETDELGRVLRTDADLDDVVRIRLGKQQIKAVDVKDGVRGTDQGGHIVGSRFFGPGEQINLYPQSANLNQGAWKQMENTWADAMVAGKDVKIKVEAVFEGASKRPEAFEVSYWIDGAKTERTFINQ